MVAVCMPSRDSVNIGTTYDLCNMMQFSSGQAIFAYAQGSLLCDLREGLVQGAVGRFSHILFIDSDMRFPPDTLRTLLSTGKTIIGANCRSRTSNSTTAFKDGTFVDSFGKTGLEQVDSLGFGVTLISTHIFTGMSEPWFATKWDEASKQFTGEDVYFCKKAKAHNHSIWIDHDLSLKIGHEGSRTLYIDQPSHTRNA